jgi:hypothetical protein
MNWFKKAVSGVWRQSATEKSTQIQGARVQGVSDLSPNGELEEVPGLLKVLLMLGN